MGFMANLSNDSGRIDAMGADNPITELTADGLFSGTVGAVGKGVAGGVAAVGRMAYDAFNAANKANIQGDNPEFGGTGGIGQGMLNVDAPKIQASDLSPQMDDALKATQEWAKIDPRTAGVGAQTLGSLAHGATVFGLGTLAGGPMAGMATMGATEGYNDYRDSVAAGVDPTTAMEKATATGLFAAAGAALPFKFGAAGIKGLVASVAGGASVNTGFGVANRYLSSEILDANGYKDMAKQYRPLDQQSMLADAILGAAFGGFAHLTHGAEAPAAARPTDDMVEQALDARRQDAVTRAGPGIPIDPEHSTLDGDLQDRALGNMLRGKPADITSDEASAMVKHTIADPERVQLHNDYQDANLAVHGDIADFSEPARVEAEPTPYAMDDIAVGDSAVWRNSDTDIPVTFHGLAPEKGEDGRNYAQVEFNGSKSYVPADELSAAGTTKPAAPPPVPAGTAQISPIHQEQLNQLALRHPDMDVEGPNGQTIKARDLPQALADHATQAASESKLHDVAMACFMRTM